VLRRVVGTIADEWFGVDREPGLPLRAQDVARVQIGRQQHVVGRRCWQFLEQPEAFADQTGVTPSVSRADRFLCPMRGHCGERTEGMRRHWGAPETTKQPGDDDILVGFRQIPERRPRFATFQQQRIDVRVRLEQAHGRVTIPEAQPLELVCRFHVRHSKLEHDGRAVAADRGRDPPRTCLAIPRRSERERPPALQFPDDAWEALEPFHALWNAVA
jgi:hypothetical protein